LPHIFYSFSGIELLYHISYYITSVLGKQVSKRNFSSPYM
jgi:tetrahydromethanopterin S-methyltransferase subunit E